MALQPAPSASRTVEIIRLLAEHPTRVFSVAELARRVDQSRATCQAVLLALEPAQWVQRTKEGYTLGPGLISVGAAARHGAAIVGLLRQAVPDLFLQTGCEVLGYLPAGDRLINVAREGPTFPGSITMVEGQAFPLSPPYGLAFAAWDDTDLERWLARAATPPDEAAEVRLRQAAVVVRELGYSVLLDPLTRRQLSAAVGDLSETKRNFVATALAQDQAVAQESPAAGAMRVSLLSAPVFGGDGSVVGLLGLVFDARQHADLAELVSALMASCRDLSQRMGAPGSGALRPLPG